MVVIAPILLLAIVIGIAISTRRNVQRQLPWERFRHALLEQFPGAGAHLSKGASNGDIKRLTHALQYPLPSAFLAMLEECNGARAIFFGEDMLSADDILREHQVWCDIIDQGLEGFTDDFSSVPEQTIQKTYASKGWVPFISDMAGNNIGFDFAPGPKGIKGQIICFGRDETQKIVIAKDFNEFLGLMRTLLQHKQVFTDTQYGTPNLPINLSWALRYLLYPDVFKRG